MAKHGPAINSLIHQMSAMQGISYYADVPRDRFPQITFGSNFTSGPILGYTIFNQVSVVAVRSDVALDSSTL